MSRLFVVSFENVAVSAAQDLFQITGYSGGPFLRIRRCIIGCTDSSPSLQMLRLRARILAPSVTDGSGGTQQSRVNLDLGDSSPYFYNYTNNTTKATTSGSANIVYCNSYNILNGLNEYFDVRRADANPVIASNETFVFELLAAPSGTIHLSASIWVEEFGRP